MCPEDAILRGRRPLTKMSPSLSLLAIIALLCLSESATGVRLPFLSGLEETDVDTSVRDSIRLEARMRQLESSHDRLLQQQSRQSSRHRDELKQLSTAVERLSRENSNLKTQLNNYNDGPQRPRVSFHATGLRNSTPTHWDTLVPWMVSVNEGNGYNSSTGFFTAPCSGTYFFSASLVGYGAGKNIAVYLMQDRIVQSYVRADFASDRYGAASLTAVLQLRAGHTASLLSTYDAASHFAPLASGNTFSGFLISYEPWLD